MNDNDPLEPLAHWLLRRAVIETITLAIVASGLWVVVNVMIDLTGAR